MNIAYAARRSFPGPGGIATHMRVVSTTLARRGHHVRVWASRIDDMEFTRLNTSLGAQAFSPQWVDGVEVRPVPMKVGALLASTPMALTTVKGLRRFAYQPLRRATAPGYVRSVGARLAADWGAPDVVHCWGGEHINWAAGHAARKRDVPLVVTPFAHPKQWGDDAMNAAFYKTAQIVMALLPSEAAVYAHLGVDQARIRVVGVPSTPLPSENLPDVRAIYGIGDAPVVLFLAVKERYKGYGLLLEAAETIWRASPDARLVFVGPRTAASTGDFAAVTDPRVIELGNLPAEEVAAWLRAATVFALPSTSEILPGAILEAWQAGKPVVAGPWWCVRDLVSHGENGLVVEATPTDVARAVITLLGDEAGARAMGAAGRALVETTYTPDVVATRHEAALGEALRG